ncbi:MAG: twin-arginine translocation signal domain-containing protein [Desulfobacteraceae bacterium]|nr:twin-arginine translocation signal domain-containing protein [Desulfobacteraceae bacterium]
MSNDRLIKDYSRRDFVKITGASLVTAALGSLMPGCATINLKKDWSKVPVKDFDMNGFDGWYMRNKLYNGAAIPAHRT